MMLRCSKAWEPWCSVCHGSWPRFPLQNHSAHSPGPWGFGSFQLSAKSLSWHCCPLKKVLSSKVTLPLWGPCMYDWSMEVRRGDPKPRPPLPSMWDDCEGPSQSRAPQGIHRDLCCDYIAVQLLPLPNPAVLVPSPALGLRTCSSKLPACKSPSLSLLPGQTILATWYLLIRVRTMHAQSHKREGTRTSTLQMPGATGHYHFPAVLVPLFEAHGWKFYTSSNPLSKGPYWEYSVHTRSLAT